MMYDLTRIRTPTNPQLYGPWNVNLPDDEQPCVEKHPERNYFIRSVGRKLQQEQARASMYMISIHNELKKKDGLSE
jgi:hypothetical protein